MEAKIDWEYVNAMKGWITKKKNKKVSHLLSGDVERWFQVETMDGPKKELALCYYKTKDTSKDARGWIYLRDVTQLMDDGKVLTIVSTARTMEIEPKSRMEHKLWLEGLMYLCSNADQRDIMTMVTNKREIDAAKDKTTKSQPSSSSSISVAEVDAIAGGGVGPSPKKRKASSNDSIGSGGSGSTRPITTSRRVDHRLGAGSGRFSSSGSNIMGTIAIPNPELLPAPGMETMQVPAPVPVPLLPSPERKGLSTTSRLHDHIRGPDNNPFSLAPDDGEAVNRSIVATGASSSSYSKRLERKCDDEDDDNHNNGHHHIDHNNGSRSRSKQQTDSRSDHRLANRGEAVAGGRPRGEEKDHGEYSYTNDQGNTFRAPRTNQAPFASVSTSHLSCYSGGYVDGDDDDEEHVIEMEDEDDSPEKQPTKGKTATKHQHEDVVKAPGKEEGGGGIGMRSSSKPSMHSGYGNAHSSAKGSSIDSKQEKDEGQIMGESKSSSFTSAEGSHNYTSINDAKESYDARANLAQAKQESSNAGNGTASSSSSTTNGKGKSRPPLPAPLQTKTPYAIPSSLSQRLATSNTNTNNGTTTSTLSSSSEIPFSDQYSPSDAMGHINLQSRGGATLSGGKINTFAFPEVKVMTAVQADANFVDANWDDTDDNVAELGCNVGPKNTLKGQRINPPAAATTTDANTKGQPPTNVSRTTNKSNNSCPSSIKADDNWLNDNFDA